MFSNCCTKAEMSNSEFLLRVADKFQDTVVLVSTVEHPKPLGFWRGRILREDTVKILNEASGFIVWGLIYIYKSSNTSGDVGLKSVEVIPRNPSENAFAYNPHINENQL